MRRLSFIVAFGIVAGLIAYALGPSTPGIPRAVTPNFSCLVEGAVGDDPSCEFVVRNDGNATLKLTTVKAPQGISIEGAGSDVAPGKEKKIRALIDTSIVVGKATVPVTIGTNDPERPELPLEVRVNIRAYLVARPGFARYIYVQKAREGTIAQTIGAVDGAPFQVLGVESPYPYLRVTSREATPEERRPEWPGSQWRVETTLLQDAPVGAVSGNVVVRTDHPKQKAVWVPVSGFVRPIIAVTPPQAKLSVVNPVSTPEVRLHLKNFADETIELTGASTTVKGILAAVKPLEAGRVYEVVLSFAPDMPDGPFQGTVQIRTASPKIPLVEVPLDGTLARPGKQ
jgi:hypothetical protein